MKTIKAFCGLNLLALLCLALFLPTAYQLIKICILIIVVLCLGILLIFSKVVWSGETVFACFLFALIGLFNSMHGAINDAPGAYRVLTVMSVWPLLYAFLSPMLNNKNSIVNLSTTFQLSLLIIIAYTFMFIGNAAGHIPDWLNIDFEENIGQGVAFYDGRVRLSLFSVASLLFLIPFLMHHILLLERQRKASVFHWTLLFTGFLLAVMTGRKGLQLAVIATPLVIYFVNLLIVRERAHLQLIRHSFSRRRLIIGSIAVFISLLFAFDMFDIRIDELINYMLGGFDFDDASNGDALARGDQYLSLMQEWKRGNVWFGHGNGSHAAVLRDDQGMPWSYELTYIYLLFSTGLFGVLFYLLWFVWGLWRVRNAIAACPAMAIYIGPMITGTIGMMVGAASNPYFGKFDYLWIVFLPHLLAGAIRYQASDNRHSNRNDFKYELNSFKS